VLNAILGVAFLHSTYNTAPETPQLQGVYQDTTYYMIPTDTLPLLIPVKAIPIIGGVLETALDPFVRVLVEAGYNRTFNPGTPNSPFYFHPLQTLANLVAAIPVAIDNVLSYIAGWDYRPLGTVKPGPYGVGGPPVRTADVDPYGPPTPALMAAPAPMMFAASLSGSGELDA
ncbi:MAG: PE-PPE domain-containing protein, partial [Mycobacterium sp.]|nr:PE-PPE domain-containing protein [Mycobacterium sp.]